MGTVATSSATWTGPGSLVAAGTWWSLATGAPGPSSFALASGSAYNAAQPALSPLNSVPVVTVDGLRTLVADFQATTGQFKLLFDVETTSVLAVSFAFAVVDVYPATANRVRVTSTSDVVGEWLAVTEIASEVDSSPEPSSGLFKAAATLSAESTALAPGDGAVYVQAGDDVALAYYDSGGSWLDGQTATVAATPKVPVAGVLGYAVLAAMFATGITWNLRRRTDSR